jgi:hypothetical protein
MPGRSGSEELQSYQLIACRLIEFYQLSRRQPLSRHHSGRLSDRSSFIVSAVRSVRLSVVPGHHYAALIGARLPADSGNADGSSDLGGALYAAIRESEAELTATYATFSLTTEAHALLSLRFRAYLLSRLP